MDIKNKARAMALLAAITATCSGQVFAETTNDPAKTARMTNILQSGCQNSQGIESLISCKQFIDISLQAQKLANSKDAGSLSGKSEAECKAKYDKMYTSLLKAVGNKPEIAAKYGILDGKKSCEKSNSR